MKIHIFLILVLSYSYITAQEIDSSGSNFEIIVSAPKALIQKTAPPLIVDTSKFVASEAKVTIINYSVCEIDSLILGDTYFGKIGIGEIITMNVSGEIALCNFLPVEFKGVVSDEEYYMVEKINCQEKITYMKDESYRFFIVRKENLNDNRIIIGWSYEYK